jgi:hypothetical protein
MTHGPGVRWLAERSGCSPEELVADPPRLLAALTSAGRASFDLALALQSEDHNERARAEEEADRLRARFEGETDPVGPARARLTAALREAAARLRDAPPPGSGDDIQPPR